MKPSRYGDRKRDIFVIGVLSGACFAGSVMLFRAAQTVGALEKSRQSSRNLASLQHRIIKRFMELTPEEIGSKVVEEFGFDVVTLNIDL